MASSVSSLPALRALREADRARAVRQDGVATTAQLVSWGLSRALVARRVEGGDWQRLFPGVMALQSGPASWRQRARAALLYAGADAALSHSSAAFHRGVLAHPGPTIEVSIPHRRRVAPQPGLTVHRRRAMPWAGGGLRAVDTDDAVICLFAETPDDDGAVGLLCAAVRGGVHPELLLLKANQHGRLRGRGLLVEMLGAVAEGIESPLEHRYRRDVERAHGLPRATAQKREQVGDRWIRADRVHEPFRVRVELDGQLAHPYGTTDDDVWRDNAVLLATGDVTLRYRWRHVAVTPCATAAQVAAALCSRGWLGTTHPCGAGCTLSVVGKIRRLG